MRILLATILVFAGFTTTSAAEWQTLKSQDGNFRVTMPGKAKTFTRTINTGVGQIKLHFFFVPTHQGKTAYMVIYNDYPAEFAKQADGKQVVNGAVNGAVRKRKGKVLKKKDISLDGHPGRWVVFESEEDGRTMRGHIRTYYVNGRLYQTMVFYDMASGPEQSDITRFLDSFARLSSIEE